VLSGEEIREATKAPAVTAVAAGAAGVIVCSVEGRAELAVLSTAGGALTLESWLPFTGGAQATALAFDTSGTRLWATGVAADEVEV
jgi:hypothetical protein